jgi:hypothetical protein
MHSKLLRKNKALGIVCLVVLLSGLIFIVSPASFLEAASNLKKENAENKGDELKIPENTSPEKSMPSWPA